jgi:hypothetical protein
MVGCLESRALTQVSPCPTIKKAIRSSADNKEGDKMNNTSPVTSCANWMRFDSIRETVVEYERKWGASDGSTNCDNMSDFNITRNCGECNMRPNFTGPTEELMQILNIFKDPIITKLEEAGMKRKCFKESKHV